MKDTASSKRASLRRALIEHLELKELPRAGWQRQGIAPCETVAAHSWGVAWLVLLLCPPNLDRQRAIAIALAHDLAEIRTGDITPHDGVPKAEKQQAERQAFRALAEELGRANEMLELSEAYGSTMEGRFVQACDKLDMALQAERYRMRDGADTGEFVRSASRALAACPWPELAELLPRC